MDTPVRLLVRPSTTRRSRLARIAAPLVLLVALLLPGGAARGETTPETRSPEVALALSAGGTLLSAGMIWAGSSYDNEVMMGVGVAGMFLMPSAGHWYAGDGDLGYLGWRVGGALSFGLGGLILVAEIVDEEQGGESGDNDDGSVPGLLFLFGGLGAYAYGVIADIATAPRAAHDFNQRQLQVMPLVAPGSAGLSLTATW